MPYGFVLWCDVEVCLVSICFVQCCVIGVCSVLYLRVLFSVMPYDFVLLCLRWDLFSVVSPSFV